MPGADSGEGFRERAARLLERFPAAQPLVERCRAAADPDLGLAGVERFADASGALPAGDDLAAALVTLCASSRLAAALLAARPALLARVAHSPYRRRPLPEARLRAALLRATRRLGPDDTEGLWRLLRRARAREVLRISLRDLEGAPLAEITAELSSLAAATLEAAIRFHSARLARRHGEPSPGGFCVLAMGKLGARELNFSSDVDLIYLYAADGETRGERPLTHFAWHAKLAELVTESLARITEDGFVFRVDLNLRPDGRSGPIVNSVRGAELYYQSFGRTWERSALTKARPVAGDLAVGEELLRLLEPFVWRRSLDFAAVDETKAMKARIDARAGAEGKDDLKLGKGGIREVEFHVTALQLLHGGKKPELRERAVVPALDKLLFAGLVTAQDREALADAYLFLRRAEHRVQMMDGRQTHQLPPPAEREALGRRMGFGSAADFETALAAHRAAVAERFAALLGAEPARPPLDPELALLADATVRDDRRRALAVHLGLADAERALASLEALARRRTPFARDGDPAAAVALLAEAFASPDPDQALAHLADFAAALQNPEPYFRLLAARPQAARLLLSLFGSSDFLSKRFLRHPELLDSLVIEGNAVLVKDDAAFRAEAAARVARAAGDVEGQLAELRRYKNEELLRIALHDVSGAIGLAAVAAQLTGLAEACLGEALALAEAEVAAKGKAPPGRLCVVGLGKLGGRELGYHSDLDLLFLYRGEEHEGFSRIATRLLSYLQMPLREGTLYKIDTRLRPSGNQGALVTSIDGFARYHQGPDAALWERQALIRARCVAGDAALFAEAERRVIAPFVWAEPGDPAALAAEVRRMRERIRAEIAREGTRRYNPKTGRGGLVDVEFAAQYLQLRHGFANERLRVTSTPLALERLRDEGLLPRPSFEALSRGYLFLRRLELRLRIVHDYSIDHLPEDPAALQSLARRLGYAGPDAGERLLSDYRRVTGEVRAAFDDVVRA